MSKGVLLSIVLGGLILGFLEPSHAGEYEHAFTDGYRNGFSFREPEGFDRYNQHGYVAGLVDGLKRASLIDKKDLTSVDIHDKVEEYYIANPADGYRPIVDVLVEQFLKT